MAYQARTDAPMTTTRPIPEQIRTERLCLTCWQPADAAALAPLLVANLEHLRPWIPEQVYLPAPLPELSERLANYAANFDADREWRFAIRTSHDHALIGEASLFARSSTGRVPLQEADRLEIGYWLDARVTSRGFATEATQALFAVAAAVAGMIRVEIRCAARNVASAAIPRRLGFKLLEGGDQTEPDLMIWYRDLPRQVWG
jgi:RimJ/RimL family protein N-acetyltransferase